MTLKRSNALFPCILLTTLLAKDLYGWGSLTHYLLGRAAAPTTSLIPFDNLPDAWPSRSGAFISEWFAWSHGVQLDSIITIPLDGRGGSPLSIPSYPSTQVLTPPGEIMYELATGPNQGYTDQAANTARGFLAHYLEDKVVHWNYFPGGSAFKWAEHERKERWGDYVIYEERLNGKFAGNRLRDLPDLSNMPDLPTVIGASVIRDAQQIKDSCRACFSAAAKSWVELNPRTILGYGISTLAGKHRARNGVELCGHGPRAGSASAR